MLSLQAWLSPHVYQYSGRQCVLQAVDIGGSLRYTWIIKERQVRDGRVRFQHGRLQHAPVGQLPHARTLADYVPQPFRQTAPGHGLAWQPDDPPAILEHSERREVTMRYGILSHRKPEHLGFACVGSAYLNAFSAAGVDNPPTPERIAEISTSLQSIASLKAISPVAMGKTLSKDGYTVRRASAFPYLPSNPVYSFDDVRELMERKGYKTAVVGGELAPGYRHAVAVHINYHGEMVIIDNGSVIQSGTDISDARIRDICLIAS